MSKSPPSPSPFLPVNLLSRTLLTLFLTNRNEPEVPALGRVQFWRTANCSDALSHQPTRPQRTVSADLRLRLATWQLASITRPRLVALFPFAVFVRAVTPRDESACHRYGGGRTRGSEGTKGEVDDQEDLILFI